MKNSKLTGNLKSMVSSQVFKKSLIFLGIILVAVIFLLKPEMGKNLSITNQKTGEVYLSTRVYEGDILKYKWIHSFEHIPWTEEYRILEDNTLLLYKMTVAGFGAGIPNNKGDTRVEDGIIIMDNIEEQYGKINWFNSHTALSYIALNGKEIIKGSDMPHHQPLNLCIEKRLYICQRFH